MDKRLEANLRVKRGIAEALFALMKEKKLKEIKVSEIVKKAGVARSSYYRNFDSKEMVLCEFLNILNEEFRKRDEAKGIKFNIDNLDYLGALHGFKFYLKYREYVEELFKNGFSYIYLDFLNSQIEEIAGDMPANSIERYKLYAYTGALFNTIVKWIEGGAKENPEEMARFFVDYMSKN